MSFLSPSDLDKPALRKALREARSREAAQLPKAGGTLATRFPEQLLPPEGGVLSGYVPIRDEIEPWSVMAGAKARGAILALPVVVEDAGPLIFRQWDFSDPLEPGAFGIQVPSASAPEVEPDVLLIPLLGFDQFGERLGYGAGHFDRTLAALRTKKSVLAVGLAYEVQRLFEVPTEPHDQRLDWIVTESAAYPAVRERGDRLVEPERSG
ncbi:MAG: 5-formyltetrahydrofolate cyclo-ligase [Maricaulaceae bacterium]|jgi:5-formyltetrahydrofolate cyclo-ligase